MPIPAPEQEKFDHKDLEKLVGREFYLTIHKFPDPEDELDNQLAETVGVQIQKSEGGVGYVISRVPHQLSWYELGTGLKYVQLLYETSLPLQGDCLFYLKKVERRKKQPPILKGTAIKYDLNSNTVSGTPEEVILHFHETPKHKTRYNVARV